MGGVSDEFDELFNESEENLRKQEIPEDWGYLRVAEEGDRILARYLREDVLPPFNDLGDGRTHTGLHVGGASPACTSGLIVYHQGRKKLMGRPRKNEAKFLLRLSPTTMGMVRHLAARSGRTLTEEVRRAIGYHVVARMIDLLDDEEFVREIAEDRPDFDEDALRAELEGDLEVARAAALGRPQTVDLVAQRVLSS